MPRKILLADDSLAVHRAVEKSLAGRDDAVRVASSGDEALAVFEEERPDVALVDVHMPGASGYEVTRQIKNSVPDVPVLLLVGTFEPYDEERGRDAGADGHLMKPFDEATLLDRVDELTGYEPTDEERAASVDSGAPADAEEPVPEPEPEPTPEPPGGPPAGTERDDGGSPAGERLVLSESDVERIARRVVELVSSEVVERLAREVLPEVAEAVVRRRIDELEREAE